MFEHCFFIKFDILQGIFIKMEDGTATNTEDIFLMDGSDKYTQDLEEDV
jgi:hypothetical protein